MMNRIATIKRVSEPGKLPITLEVIQLSPKCGSPMLFRSNENNLLEAKAQCEIWLCNHGYKWTSGGGWQQQDL